MQRERRYSIFFLLFLLIFIMPSNLLNHTKENPFKGNNNYLLFNQYCNEHHSIGNEAINGGTATAVKTTRITASNLIAKLKMKDIHRNFFHLFNVPYIICFFAAKGKWPFIPTFMQVKVDQVSRTIFTRNDNYIRNYCRGWFNVNECHRPIEFNGPVIIYPSHSSATKKTPSAATFSTTTINTDVETFNPASVPNGNGNDKGGNGGEGDDDNNRDGNGDTDNGDGDESGGDENNSDDDENDDEIGENKDGEPDMTPCTCPPSIKKKFFPTVSSASVPLPSSPASKLPTGILLFGSGNHVQNMNAETIVNIIEYLESLIPSTGRKHISTRRRNSNERKMKKQKDSKN